MTLTTSYLGMTLKNPIVVSSSPLSHNVDSIRRLEDAGAAAVVMYSLFEEQITFDSFYVDYYLTSGTNSYAESLSYFPEMESYNVWPDEYMNLIRRAKEAVDIPIVGSLNGVSAGGWTDYAALMEEAGADAVELNVYYIPTNEDLEGSEVENIYLEILREVKRSVSLPVAIKLSPYFSSTANMARRLVQEGANGLVLFNRFINLTLISKLSRSCRVWFLATPASYACPCDGWQFCTGDYSPTLRLRLVFIPHRMS
jgi:dihydroorotate dehydrogenase (fumarate)